MNRLVAESTTADPQPETQAPDAKCRPRHRSFAAALVVTLLCYFAHDNFVPLRDAETYFVDFRLRHGRLTAPNTNLVYISVDRVTYDGHFIPGSYTNITPDDRYFMEILRGEFPWNREVFAEAVDQLANLGASKILLNFTFATQKPEDPEFQKILNRHATKVIIGASFHVDDSAVALSYPSPTLIQPNEFGDFAHDQRIGFVSTHEDPDGVARRAIYDLSMNQIIQDNLSSDPAMVFPEDIIFESLSSRVMRSLGRGDELPPASDPPLLRYTGPRHTFKTISLKSLFDPVERKANFERTGFFRDKIVIIGPGQAVLAEQHRTPFRVANSAMDGSELHLNYLNAALQRELVAETSQPANQAIVLGAGAALVLLAFFVATPLCRIGGGVVLAGAWLVIAFWQYNQHNLMIGAVISPMLLLALGGMTTALFDQLPRPAEKPPTISSESSPDGQR